jgi:hypothetical protein
VGKAAVGRHSLMLNHFVLLYSNTLEQRISGCHFLTGVKFGYLFLGFHHNSEILQKYDVCVGTWLELSAQIIMKLMYKIKSIINAQGNKMLLYVLCKIVYS